MASGIQFKLRGFSIVNGVQDQLNQMADTDKLTDTAGNIFTQSLSILNGVQDQLNQMADTDKLTDTAGNIFTQSLSTVQNFSGFLIHANDILPPDNPDEPINHWVNIVAHYLLVAVILIVVIGLFICFFSCLVSVFSCLFMCIFSVIRFLFMGILSIIGFLFMGILSIIGFLFMGIYSIVRSVFVCIFSVAKFLYSGLSSTIRSIYVGLMNCVGMGSATAGKMMVAPGRAPLLIPRAVFEANPQGYFAALRGRV